MDQQRIVATIPAEWIDPVGPVEGVEIVAWDLDGPPQRADEIDFVCMPYFLRPEHWDHLPSAPNATAIQLLSAGYEHALPHLPAGAQLMNARGVHDVGTAEHAMALTLSMQRGVRGWMACHEQRRWLPIPSQPGVAGQRVLIVGYGSIGSTIARRMAAFEPASITAVASRARAGDDLVEAVHGVDELPSLLPKADIVVCIVPATEATRGLVDADFLARMPDGALLVNVGRGPVVDTDALVAATANGRIRAAMDVTDPEPLPDDHPLWSCPHVVISPHTGGDVAIFWQRAADLIRAQLERLGRGEALANVVA